MPEYPRVPFDRAYFRWLKARAAIHDEEIVEDGIMRELNAAEEQARKDLFLTRAACSDQLWSKLEVFEMDLQRELRGERLVDPLLLLGLASLKADLLDLVD